MRVLLVEDYSLLAGLVQRELQSVYGHTVELASDPLEAAGILARQEFDVVVIDIFYDALLDGFEARRLARTVTLTSAQLLMSGLSTVQRVAEASKRAGVVLWTAGDGPRRLHMLYAHEELHVRAYCSKTAHSGRTNNLNEAIRAARAGQSYVDPVLNPYLPTATTIPLRRTILRDPARRAIWRAIALGYHTRDEIKDVTGYAKGTVGNLISQIATEDLPLAVPGLRSGKSPLSELVTYASARWAFFLDDAVRKAYP